MSVLFECHSSLDIPEMLPRLFSHYWVFPDAKTRVNSLLSVAPFHTPHPPAAKLPFSVSVFTVCAMPTTELGK